MKPLTDKQQMFVLEYLKDFNAKRAAKAVGYKSSTVGAKLLEHPTVKKLLSQKLNKVEKIQELTTNLVLEKLLLIVNRDIRDYMDPETGKLDLMDLRKLSDKAATLIDSIKVTEKTFTDKEGNPVTVVSKDIKLVSLLPSLELAAKILGMLIERRESMSMVQIDWDSQLNKTKERRIDIVETMIANPEVIDGEKPKRLVYDVEELIRREEEA